MAGNSDDIDYQKLANADWSVSADLFGDLHKAAEMFRAESYRFPQSPLDDWTRQKLNELGEACDNGDIVRAQEIYQEWKSGYK